MPRILFGILLGLMVAVPASAQRDVTLPTDSTTVLQPGDMVQITVWRNAELSGQFPVGANGALVHPLYQQVPIAGIPLHEAEQRIVTFLKKYETDPQVAIVPLLHITVAGAVQKPSLYNFPRETSIGEAIALAGGPTTDGRLNKVKLYRGGREIPIDLQSPLTPWASRPIASGDVIIVGRAGNFFRNILLPIIATAGSIAAVITVIRRK